MSDRARSRAAWVVLALSACSRGESTADRRAESASRPPDCVAAVSNAQLRAQMQLKSAIAPAPGQRQRRLYFGALGDSSRRRHLYDFDVDSQVRRVDDDTSAAPVRNPRALVQFVVDSAGAVDTATVQVIGSRDRSLTREAAVQSVRAWRYRPARFDGCVVPQLLQVELR